jgi:hypothetical protein
LAPANQAIISVKPDSTLAEVVGLLLLKNFSQLPVMTNERDVKGVITWTSIGSRLALAKTSGEIARHFMEPHHEIRSSLSIFDAIPIIVTHQYVLVRSEDNKISGIITASDLSEQFRLLAEPFLLLGEIENLLRGLIADRFSSDDLAGVRDPGDSGRKIQGPDDLAFGEYLRLFEKPERWEQFGLAIDRVGFCRDLDSIRQIRNDVSLVRKLLLWGLSEYQRVASIVSIDQRDEHRRDWAHMFLWRATAAAPIIKNPAFAEEAEWRLIHLPLFKEEVRFIAKQTGLSPFTELRLGEPQTGSPERLGRLGHELPDRLPIKKLWSGPGRSTDTALLAGRTLLEQMNYGGVGLEASKIPYRVG